MPSAAEAAIDYAALIAAVNRCATQERPRRHPKAMGEGEFFRSRWNSCPSRSRLVLRSFLSL
jgi:hypothetical protein